VAGDCLGAKVRKSRREAGRISESAYQTRDVTVLTLWPAKTSLTRPLRNESSTE
jgi:hypothetical protein